MTDEEKINDLDKRVAEIEANTQIFLDLIRQLSTNQELLTQKNSENILRLNQILKDFDDKLTELEKQASISLTIAQSGSNLFEQIIQRLNNLESRLNN